MKRRYLAYLCVISVISLQAQSLKPKVNIVFIGNSITYGACLGNPRVEAPPVRTVDKLKSGGYEVKYANCGYNGKTTVDFLPESGQLFHSVVLAADTLSREGGCFLFSITLGTNDSAVKGTTGAPVSPEKYRGNLLMIIDSLHCRYPESYFILHRPLWYSPNTHNTVTYLEEGLERLKKYTPVLNKMAKDKTYILRGDRDAFDFFKKNPVRYFVAEKGNSGTFYLHPNACGADVLAEFWTKNIEKHLQVLKRRNK